MALLPRAILSAILGLRNWVHSAAVVLARSALAVAILAPVSVLPAIFMSMTAMGGTQLPSITAARVHAGRDNLKVLKAGALPVTAKVVQLKSLWDNSVDVLVVPLVRINLFSVLILECTVARRVKGASPFPAA